MLRNLLALPIVLSAALLQGLLGAKSERSSDVWQHRLKFADFFAGSFALFGLVGLGVISLIGWITVGNLDFAYAARAAAAVKRGDHAEALICFERLAAAHPEDRKYRYALALAHEQTGDVRQAVGMMSALAPPDSAEFAPAQLWIARRILTDGRTITPEALRDAESRLIRLRSSPEVGGEASELLAKLYIRTSRIDFVLKEPTLRSAAERVPELHLRLLQAQASSLPAATFRVRVAELVDVFRNRLSKAPDDREARRSLAQSQLMLGDVAAAAVTLREGLTLSGDDPELRSLLATTAVTEARAAALTKAAPGLQRSLAEAAVRAVQEYAPPGDATTVQLAQMQRLAGDEAAAEKTYRLVADRFPLVQLELGEMLLAAGRKDDAQREFLKLLQAYDAATPTEQADAARRALAGIAAYHLARYDRAVALLSSIVDRHPAAKPALLPAYMAQSDAALPSFPPAKLDPLRAALKLEPFYLPAIQRLLNPGTDAEYAVAARKVLLDMVAAGDAPAAAYLLLGTDAMTRGDQAEAIKYLEQAERLTPNSPAVLNNLAWTTAFGDKPDLARALQLIDAALVRAPGNVQLRDTRGRILAKLGRWQEALVELEACLEHFEGQADFHRTIAGVYRRLELFELAERHDRFAAESEKKAAAEPAKN